ncbi:MAG TPA: protease complex subunit PrcB family protein [Trueperaceae bacterium]|nr:protease complex subunit PrcB family protein [Trueperaceae bacterium]
MRFVLPALAVLVLFAGCVPQSGPKLHDVYVYGALNERLSYLYGSPGTISIDGKDVTLTQGTKADPFAVTGALLADGKPYLSSSLQPPKQPPVVVSHIPLTTDLELQVNQDVQQVVYFDGGDYLTLADSATAGTTKRVVPTPRLNGLRGLGQLTDPEADALANGLSKSGKPFVVAVLPEKGLPAHAVNGTSEYLHTGLYVQQGLATATAAAQGSSQQVPWEVLAHGQHAVGFDKPQYDLVTSQDQLTNLWYQAYGTQLQVPSVPQLDFSRETVVAIFEGKKPTGGYGLEVRGVTIQNGELYIDLVETSPSAGAITTQAITSPWLILHVLHGGFQVAWIRNPDDGSLIAVARATQ